MSEIQKYQEKPQAVSAFTSQDSFESAMRMATIMSSTDLVPASYKGKPGNCVMALEIAQRTGSSVLAVMQSLHIIQGKPSWSSQYIIAAVNSSRRFSSLRFKKRDLGMKEVEFSYWDGPQGNRTKKNSKLKIHDFEMIAYATDLATGDVLTAPPVTVEMAVKEGWYTKPDSKWPTMTELMLTYRSATFFGRLYAPEILMGMRTEDETRDMVEVDSEVIPAAGESTTAKLNEKIKKSQKKAENSSPPPTAPEAAPEVLPPESPPTSPQKPGPIRVQSIQPDPLPGEKVNRTVEAPISAPPPPEVHF